MNAFGNDTPFAANSVITVGIATWVPARWSSVSTMSTLGAGDAGGSSAETVAVGASSAAAAMTPTAIAPYRLPERPPSTWAV